MGRLQINKPVDLSNAFFLRYKVTVIYMYMFAYNIKHCAIDGKIRAKD